MLRCSETFQIPLPGPGQCLVEIVDIEDDAALGRPEQAEVQEVCIAAGLHVNAGRRRSCKISRHDRRAAAEERERTGRHARVSQRDEVGDPALGLAPQDCQGGTLGNWALQVRFERNVLA